MYFHLTSKNDISVVTSTMTQKKRREESYVDDAALQISLYLILASSLLKRTEGQHDVLTAIPPGKFPPTYVIDIKDYNDVIMGN